MKALFLFTVLAFVLVSPAFGEAAEPCAKKAQEIYKAVTGRAPSQFALASQKFNSWAGSQEYVYLAANGPSSAYVIELFYLDGRSCFLNSMRYDGDM